MLTPRQRQILDFIMDFRRDHGCSPSIPEMQRHFGIRSPNGVVGHLLALESKGVIRRGRRGSRQIDLAGPLREHRSVTTNLPLYEQAPEGAAEPAAGHSPEARLSMDELTLGFRPREGCFALRMRGDSMQQAGIYDGDLVVVEPTPNPEPDQIVAAVIGGESTLKRLVRVRGRWFLKAEHPAYPELHPRSSLKIQGVVRTLIRRFGV